MFNVQIVSLPPKVSVIVRTAASALAGAIASTAANPTVATPNLPSNLIKVLRLQGFSRCVIRDAPARALQFTNQTITLLGYSIVSVV